MNKILYTILSMLIVLLTLLVVSLRRPLTDKTFIVNTYGYVALALLLVTLVVLYFDKKNISITPGQILLSFIVGIICIFSIYSVKSSMLKHIVWLVFILSIGILLYPTYRISVQDGTILKVLLTTIIMFVSLSIFVFFSKQSTFTSWGGYLLFALFSLIVVELFDVILFKNTEKRLKVYGMITVVLFSGFILYDTDVLRQRSKFITKPDYPTESMGLFLDAINLFSGLVSSNSK